MVLVAFSWCSMDKRGLFKDIEALKDVNNITEKKTRSKSASLRGIEVTQGEEAAKELADLGIPLPQQGKEIEVKSKKASTGP